jgi:hypothetical protein
VQATREGASYRVVGNSKSDFGRHNCGDTTIPYRHTGDISIGFRGYFSPFEKLVELDFRAI